MSQNHHYLLRYFMYLFVARSILMQINYDLALLYYIQMLLSKQTAFSKLEKMLEDLQLFWR